MPPVIYFLLHLISLIIQSGNITLITDRLMFLLVPVFGIPLFMHFNADDDIVFFKAFTAGIIMVSIVLVFRIIIFVNKLVPADMNFIDYAVLHKYWFFSAHLSVFEHPTYFSMKIIWVLLIFIFAHERLKINNMTLFILSVFLSCFLVFIASRSSMVFWVVIAICFIVQLYRKKLIKGIYLFIIIPVSVFLAVISLEKNGRINDAISEIRIKLNEGGFEWKNIDQRTREWYTAIQVIKADPFGGAGFVQIKDRMREEYLKHGFYEEAKLNLNAHNQFLEAQMTFGIAGTVSLLLMLFALLYRKRLLEFPELAFSFVIMISFFLMFESMLNRQWGVMFFLIFYFILANRAEKSDTTVMYP